MVTLWLLLFIDKGKILAQGSSEELRAKYSNDRVKIIPKNGLIDILKKDGVDYYLFNDLIHIKLDFKK